MMKMSAELYRKFETAIAPLDTDERRERYRAGRFPNAETCHNLSVRYRWDLLRIAPDSLLEPAYNAGLNDVHVDTALRRIVPEIEK